MKIGVLGTGVAGQTVGGKLVEMGHDVMMGARAADNEKVVGFAQRIRPAMPRYLRLTLGQAGAPALPREFRMHQRQRIAPQPHGHRANENGRQQGDRFQHAM